MVEPRQLIEHLVQSRGDRPELVATGHRRPRTQIAFCGFVHDAQNGMERLTHELTDSDVDEDRHEHDGGEREPEGDAKFVRARLEQTLQPHRDRHGIIPSTRHRQGEHHDGAAAIARESFGGDRSSRQVQDFCAFFR